ncbi:MAG TPA: bifunctional homocysteine S-methyltransferase/methylenetetrahydrofolate reductase [Chloroflexota bacterium]|nr:bifunctional homocysteine S-methyltransferase/methylenetetrahydrofolate reductase [Chloroflexota bacterium]
MESPFLKRLRRGAILADGAMGTMLYSKGVSYERCFEEVTLSDPALVEEIHRAYLSAGAELIETNSFGANRFKLADYGLENRVREINLKAAKLARSTREIAGVECFVAGSVGPLGRPLAPVGQIRQAAASAAFQEQIGALLEGGVDLILLETFPDLEELALALQVAHDLCDLPVVAQATFAEDGLTASGSTPEEVVRRLRDMGAAVAGVNCSLGPQQMLEIVQRMIAEGGVPISAMPNAGLPAMVGGRLIYRSTPPYMAEYALKYVHEGASMVGGCCGTTPAHIAAMRTVLAELRPAEPLPPSCTLILDESPTPPAVGEPSPLKAKLGKQFVVSVEMDPPKGANPTKLLNAASVLREVGVDAVNIADSPMARVRMSAMAMGFLVKQQLGLETIIHFTTRDRNLMAIQSELIGAHAIGIRAILALTGDPPRLGDQPGTTAVFDVDSIGLIRIIRRLNEGQDWRGNSIGEPTNFLVGCALNPNADDLELELDRFRQKLEAGVDFVLTQPVYDMETLLRVLDRVEGVEAPILLGVLPLQSSRHTEYLHNEVPGITVPDPIRERMRQAGEHGMDEGVTIAREFLREARSYVQGAYLMPSFGRFEQCAEILR